MKYFKLTDKFKTKELSYRPKRIFDALQWLKIHNHLYKNINLTLPEYWNIKYCNASDELYLNDNIFEIDKNEEQLIFSSETKNNEDEKGDNNYIISESEDDDSSANNNDKDGVINNKNITESDNNSKYCSAYDG
jgi:hypothetical protein